MMQAVEAEDGGAVKAIDEALSSTNVILSASKSNCQEIPVLFSGFLWKFPSEGSNQQQSEADCRANGVDQDFPRKCPLCRKKWVSCAEEEAKHLSSCLFNESQPESRGDAAESLKWGVPRRVWCEIDEPSQRFQWRLTPGETQQESHSVLLHEILEVSGTETHGFCVTTSSRRIALESRQATAELSRLDVERWIDALNMMIFLGRERHHNEVNSPTQVTRENNSQTIHATCDATQEQQESSSSSLASSTGCELVTLDEHENDKLTAIMLAITTEDVEELRQLVTEDAHFSLDDFVDDQGNSLLLAALKLGARETILETLLDLGVDCNAKNNEGESPLLVVAAAGENEILALLLKEQHLDVNQRCCHDSTAFLAAASAGDLQMLQKLLAAGAIPNVVDSHAWTALHYAAACSDGLQAVRFLCELIPECLDWQCQLGNTALHVAAMNGCLDNVQALLETAANPHIANQSGNTAYHLALQHKKISCAVCINEYMENSCELYDRKAHASIHPSVVDSQVVTGVVVVSDGSIQAEATDASVAPMMPTSSGSMAARTSSEYLDSSWVEYRTEEGIPYYYNAFTGQSSWIHPASEQHHHDQKEPSTSAAFPTIPSLDAGAVDDIFGDDSGAAVAVDCMAPMISELLALEDPNAWTRLDEQRKRARTKRRTKPKLARRSSHSSCVN